MQPSTAVRCSASDRVNFLKMMRSTACVERRGKTIEHDCNEQRWGESKRTEIEREGQDDKGISSAR
jgi:hypothetical protein